MILVNGFPRRNRLDLNCPAELAIREAMLAVEKVGAHPLLTEAVSLLGRAKEVLADFVELVPEEPGTVDVLPVMLNGRRVEYAERVMEKVIVKGRLDIATDVCFNGNCQQGELAAKLVYEDGKRRCPVCGIYTRNLPLEMVDKQADINKHPIPYVGTFSKSHTSDSSV